MTTFKYDGFISYSTRADGDLAPKIQDGLEQLAKPWNKRRALKIFQDIDDLAANPDLGSTLRRELEQSNTLVYLASEAAAASTWCNDELTYWLASRPATQLVVVLTDGTLEFDQHRNRPTVFERSTSAPQAFANLTTVPLYIDMRPEDARTASLDHRRDPEFRAKLTKIAAVLHSNKSGVPVEPRDIDSADLAAHRKARRLRTFAVISLAVLAVAATLIALFANRLRLEAEDSARRATSRALAASSGGVLAIDPELASLLALESRDVDNTVDAARALGDAVRSPWRSTLSNNDERPTSIGTTADGARVLMVLPGRTVLRDVASGSDVASFVDAEARIAAVSPDGTRVVTGGPADAAVWDAAGARLGALDAAGIASIEFSQDGERVLTAGADGVRVWDISDGESVVVTDGAASGASFNPDGSKVVTWRSDASDPVVWDLAAGTATTLVAPDPGDYEGVDQVYAARFDLTGTRIVTAKGATVRVWSADGGWLETLPAALTVRAQSGMLITTVDDVGFDRRGRVVVAGANGASVWDDGRVDPTVLTTDFLTAATVTADGTRAVTQSVAGLVQVWQLVDLPVLAVDPVLLANAGGIDGSFSADGRRIVAFVSDGNQADDVVVWETSGAELALLASNQRVGALLDRSGDRIVIDEGQFGIAIHDVADGALPITLTRDRSGSPSFDATGTLLAVPTFDAIELWSFTGALPSLTGSIPARNVERVLFDPRGATVLAISNDGAQIWGLDGESMGELPIGDATPLSYRPDGAAVLVAADDGVRIVPLDGSRRSTIITSDPVSDANFSPDGTLVVTASPTSGVVVWDTDGIEVTRLSTTPSSAAEFNADGSQILAAGQDGVRLWAWPSDEELQAELATRLRGRTFTATECELYSISRCGS